MSELIINTGLLFWSGEVSRGVSRDEVLHVLAARLSESEVYQWGMQCNKALRILFPLVVMKRKGKYKTTVYFGVDFTPAAKRLVPAVESTHGMVPWHEQTTMTC
ncbi:hypothetical protein V1264_006107 [Littorina saxatilis]|uniref:Uncharacterized protein n=1 Tax=Littorina saxatilis TaxID=31220 RepID=A0AAN9AWZ0_9CAEN